jgi:hypothetical protein
MYSKKQLLRKYCEGKDIGRKTSHVTWHCQLVDHRKCDLEMSSGRRHCKWEEMFFFSCEERCSTIPGRLSCFSD